MPDLPDSDPFWDMMKSLWAEQKARGHVPRSFEEIEAERRETREGWARRQEAIERLQEEARRLLHAASAALTLCPGEPSP